MTHPLNALVKPMVASAPFGNWIGLGSESTRTLGTYTLERRPGRLSQVIKTLRPKFRERAWVNKLGLRNPGLPWLTGKINGGRKVSDKIVSVHGFNVPEWLELFAAILGWKQAPLAVEVNASCPNVGAVHDLREVMLAASGVDKTIPVIVKVPPAEMFRPVFDAAVAAGLTAFHCTNTLPCPEGGKSGAPLLPHALEAVRTVRREMPGAFIIGGGGVQSWDQVCAHTEAGADKVAVASCLLWPWNWVRARLWASRLKGALDTTLTPV